MPILRRQQLLVVGLIEHFWVKVNFQRLAHGINSLKRGLLFTDRALQPDDSRDGIFNYARYHDLAIRLSGEVGAVAYGAGVLKSCYMLLRLEGILRRSASRLCAWVAAKALTR